MAASAPPTPRVDRVVTVTTYNTVFLANGEVVQLVTPYSGPYYFNIMNLGPCTVYYADDHDPFPGDSNSSVMPPGGGDNGIFVCCGGGDCGDGNGGGGGGGGGGGDHSPGLRVTAGPPCACGPGLGPPQCPPPGGKPPKCPATITVRLVRG